MNLGHVLIADDHSITRRGVRDLILELDPKAQCVEAADGHAALEQIDSRPWGLILVDVMMPGPTVLELIDGIRRKGCIAPILVLTASDEVSYIAETIRAGANGLVHKHRAADELLEAVRVTSQGGTYLHPESAAALAASLRSERTAQPHEALSERELDIFRRIARGQAIKEIAYDLGLSDKTVATYLARIRTKTGLLGKVEIARYALQHRLVD